MKVIFRLSAIFCLWQDVLCLYNLNLPVTIEAVSGQCVVIPCTFEIDSKDNALLKRDAEVIWILNNPWHGEKVFNSAKPANNKIKGEIKGDLSQKNCTTIFYDITKADSGNYYFRIETTKYSFSSGVNINVRASPSSPSLRLYKDEVEVNSKEVLEGSSVSLFCSAETVCPSQSPTLKWSILPTNTMMNHHVNFTSSPLTFIISHQHNNLTFTCTASYLLKRSVIQSVNTSLTLHVQYAPRNVCVSATPSGQVMLGSSVSLSCSSDANPAVLNYTWYRENGEQIGSEAHLTINKTDDAHSGLYYCRAKNQHGAQNSSLMLDIQYAPRNVCVSGNPSGQVMLGSSVSLSCNSDANPAVLNYTWYRENGEQIGSEAHLTINKTDDAHSGLYYCRAKNQHGAQNSSLMLDIQYAPRNVCVSATPSGQVMSGSSVSLSCYSDANPAVLNYTWYRENGEQIGSEAHLTINKTDATHSGLYYCRAKNQHGAQNSSLMLDIQYMPQITLSSSCNSSDGNIVCLCEVYGSPSPKLEWLMNGQLVVPSSNDPAITEITVGSTGVRSFLTIHQSPMSMSNLQCVVSNELGSTSQLFFIANFPSSGLHAFSVLIGAAVGATAVMILCLIYCCKRRAHHKSSPHGQDNTTTDKEEEDIAMYANKIFLSSSQELSESNPDSLNYTTIVFPKGAEGSGKIMGLSSLTSDYATIQYHTKDGVKENTQTQDTSTIEERQTELDKKTRKEILQLTEEEAVYSDVIHHHSASAQVEMVADMEVKQMQAKTINSKYPTRKR